LRRISRIGSAFRTGAQIAAPTRQAAIKRPLLALFTQPAEAKAAAG
jgi:hypothetical protein